MIIDKDRKPTPPGEWEVDSNGKRFRYDGRCIEYEQTITTSCGTVTRSQLEAMNAREKPAFTPPAWGPPAKICPFKDGAQRFCGKGDCAWYVEGKCAAKCPSPNTGKKCPHTNTNCVNNCALR